MIVSAKPLVARVAKAAVYQPNGTSLRQESLQTPPGMEENKGSPLIVFDILLANTAFLNPVQGSLHFCSVSARLARYQLY
jgi:hypothetical protein